MGISSRDLEDVRFYLRQWAWWTRRWRPGKEWPRSCLDAILAPQAAWDSGEDQTAESDERGALVDEHILHSVEQCVAQLDLTRRCALRHFYLREHMDIPVNEARTILKQAEIDLIPLLRRRNVLIGITV